MSTKNQPYKSKKLNPGVDVELHPHSIHRVPPIGWGPGKAINAEVLSRPKPSLAARIVLNALDSAINYSYDTTVTHRLKDFITAVKRHNPWYKFWLRNADDKRLKAFIGFQFNKLSPLENFLKTPFSAAIDKQKGKAKFSIPSFIPASDITWPGNDSLCRIRTILTGIDLQTGDFHTVAGYSPPFKSDIKEATSYKVEKEIPSGTYPLLIYCCGIDFFTPFGKNDAARILDIKYNPMDVIGVEHNY